MTYRSVLLAAMGAGFILSAATPAFADGWRGGHRGGGGWHGGGWHGGGWNRGYYRGYAPYYYYGPRAYYAPPPVYYAPPAYYAYPGVSFNFRIP